MANAIRYSTTGDTQSLKKGNFFFGVGDVGKGPSSATTYYNGSTPVASGYTIYSFDASQTSRISYASPTTDSEFISITNAKSGQNFTGVTQCLNWYATQTDYVAVNKDYEPIVSNGLVLNLDASYTPSYTSSGTTWYDLSYSGNNGTLTNGPTYSGVSGGTIVFDGIDDYCDLSSLINFNDGLPFTVQCFISIPYFTGQNLNRVHWLSGVGGNSMMIFNSTFFSMWNEAGGVNNLIINYNFPTNQIFHATITRNSNNIVSLYVNGVYINQGSRSGQFRWATIARLGSITTYCSRFSLFNMMIYGRDMSISEILQNFNAQKSRFGL